MDFFQKVSLGSIHFFNGEVTVFNQLMEIEISPNDLQQKSIK